MSLGVNSVSLGLAAGSAGTSSGAPIGGVSYTNSASVRFDGTNDNMQLASQIEYTGAFTFSIWVHPVSGNEGWISAGTSGASGPWLDWYGAAYGNSWVLRNMGTINGTAGAAKAGVWYHIAIIRDSSNVVKMWVDNSQQGSNSSFTGTAEFSQFAAYSSAGNTALNGYLDEIAFWGSDQTSNLAAIYNSGLGADLKGLSPDYWYRMGDINGSSGDTIANQGSGGSNDGTLTNGPTYSSKVPYVLPPQTNSLGVDFDGTDDYLAIAANASLNTAGDWSFTAWINADDLSSYEAIAAKRTGGYDWQFAVSGSKLILTFGTSTTVSGSTTLSTGTWYHVAFTVDVGVTNGVKLFVNGTQENNTTTSATSSNAGAYGLTIGDNTIPRWWNGKMDEIAMFHTCLTAEEVHVIYNDGVPPDIDSLFPVAWWRLGDGTGDTDSGGGTPANADTVGTIVNQGSANTGSGQGNATAGNAPTYTNSIPS